MPGGWQNSTRGTQLPPNWRTEIRPAVLTRDGHHCAWLDDHPDTDGGFADYLAGNYQPHQRCNARGADVDHVNDPHDHSIDNCRTLCDWHHNRRSSRQGNTAQRRPNTQLPREPHPGLL